MVSENEWWIANFLTEDPEITTYVNIGTPPEWNGSHVTQIDLDLDVIRRLDGTVKVIDEDEFAENRVEFGYPDELVTGAREAADRAAGLLRDSVEPFDAMAREWIAKVDPESLRFLDDGLKVRERHIECGCRGGVRW